MINDSKFDLDYKKLKLKFNDSVISLDEYINSLTKILVDLKRYVLYPLQLNTNINTLLHSNRSFKLYKVIKDEIQRYSSKYS
tara:strand:+ start:948 stop:1193 length:246 start_codon:yes stop_codon:yes gene_type:complete